MRDLLSSAPKTQEMRRFMLLQAVNTVGFAHSLAQLQAQSSRQVHWCQTALACFADQDRIFLPKAPVIAGRGLSWPR
jgi:hypothetical protein